MTTAADPTAADPTAHEAGALAGLKVLDVATLFAGPLAATLLGDHGAEVIKIEHPRGDPSRTHGAAKDGVGLWWKMLGRNKKSITLVLSSDRRARRCSASSRRTPTWSSRTSGPGRWSAGASVPRCSRDGTRAW